MRLRVNYFVILALVFGVALTLVRVSPSRAATQQCVSSALAGGTADALTVTSLPCTATTTLLILTLSATNTTTTPTLQMTGGVAQTIVNADGTALRIGQLVNGATILLTNTGSNWKIMNGAPE